MPMPGSKRVAKIIFGGTRIAGNFLQDEVCNSLEQLCFWMPFVSFRIIGAQTSCFHNKSIKGFTESGMNEESPDRLGRLFPFHRVTSSGIGSSSRTLTPLVNSRASLIRAAES